MPKKKGRSRVYVYPAWCKGCGICVEFCPSKVLELDEQGKARAVRENECVNCGFCELHCPDFAIVVKPPEKKKSRS
ncbi:MAG: ferredoxin family protein, partial [Desulfovibrionales bacterium]